MPLIIYMFVEVSKFKKNWESHWKKIKLILDYLAA